MTKKELLSEVATHGAVTILAVLIGLILAALLLEEREQPSTSSTTVNTTK